MKQIRLDASIREETGSGAAMRYRRAGKIPAVIYGESGLTHLLVDSHAFAMAWREVAGRAALMELHFGKEDESHFAVIQETQRDPRTDTFQHIDFREVVRGKPMDVAIPVVLKGISPGVKNGGVLDLTADTVEVRCRPRDLPEAIPVDVSKLQIGDVIHVEDLPSIEGIEVLTPGNEVVVSCLGVQADSEAEDEGTEPELVGQKGKGGEGA